MEDFKDLKKKEYVIYDEELDHVAGGIKTISYLEDDSSKNTVVTGRGECDTIRNGCPYCNSQEVMKHDAFIAHVKTFHPEKL